MNYFSFKVSDPNAKDIVDSIKNEKDYVEIQQLNQLEESLVPGSLIFIMLGGDRVSWDKGLIGLAAVTKAPFNKGYDPQNKRNFMIGMKMLFSLKEPIKREEFIFYYDSYNAGGIGPATKGEQNQAIKSLTEDQAITIIRAMLDKDSSVLPKLEGNLTSEFIAKIKGKIPMLRKLEVAYGEVVNSNMSIHNQACDKKLSVGELGSILNKMYYASTTSNKTTAIHMFGLKYGKQIKESGYSTIELIKASGLNESYQTEIGKGVRMYEAILNNEFGVLFNNEVKDEDKRKESRVTGGENYLYYGVPGAGKSFSINKQISGSKYERVVFHPDYTYADFIGQIMPKLKKMDGDEKLSYEFVPGPFIKAVKMAEETPDQMFYLVIEEINRGNAPAIFGDVFQLLDRDEKGSSEYYITNFDLGRELFGNENAEIRIPSNLSILATMNTSDQNVFTLDTAFQRRWNMKYIKNDVDAAIHADKYIQGSNITWGNFANTVNEEILRYGEELVSAEDKQLGAYFVEEDELSSDKFPEKALKYLWDDAFKMDHEKIFKPDFKSLGGIIEHYDIEVQQGRDPIKRIMRADVYKKMMDMAAESVADAIDESEVFDSVPVIEEK